MVYRKDRYVWGAVLFRTTRPEVVEGAIVRRSERLHWISEAAVEEVLQLFQGAVLAYLVTGDPDPGMRALMRILPARPNARSKVPPR